MYCIPQNKWSVGDQCEAFYVEDGKYYGSFDQQVHPADGHGFYPIGAGAAMWGN